MAEPRNLINLEAVSKAYGDRPLLAEVSLGVGAGQRIGVVGRNGAGKSTLLALLGGAEPADVGRVSRTGGTRVGLLRQHADEDPSATVGSVVVGSRPEHEWAADARTRAILDALLGGYDATVLARQVGTLSGGERRRVELARLLIDDLDLLLLDEPTNHLDLEVVTWLARHLADRPELAVVVVTHDRWFLDEVCEAMWEVVGGRVEEYVGGYSAYVLAKAERQRQGAAADARRANLIRKELAWLRRGAPARTSKPRFRVEAANELIRDEPAPRDSVELLAFAGARLGRTVVELHDVSYRIGERDLLDRVTWDVGPGQRIGILGSNGVGKTTVVRVMLGELRPSSGRVVTGTTVRPAYLSQHLEELDPTWRVLESVERIAHRVDLGKGRELSAGQLCERLGFGPDGQWTPVGDLSGGERRRLQLTRLLMGAPNLLVLDEPTNDFDTETLAALEDLLDGFAGTLIVVSHDRFFVERVCDDVVALRGDGAIRPLPGGVEEYLALGRAPRPGGPRAADPGATGSDRAGPGRSDAAVDRDTRKTLARLERQIERLTRREAELHDDLARHALDHVKAAALHDELRSVTAERTELEERWLTTAM